MKKIIITLITAVLTLPACAELISSVALNPVHTGDYELAKISGSLVVNPSSTTPVTIKTVSAPGNLTVGTTSTPGTLYVKALTVNGQGKINSSAKASVRVKNANINKLGHAGQSASYKAASIKATDTLDACNVIVNTNKSLKLRKQETTGSASTNYVSLPGTKPGTPSGGASAPILRWRTIQGAEGTSVSADNEKSFKILVADFTPSKEACKDFADESLAQLCCIDPKSVRCQDGIRTLTNNELGETVLSLGLKDADNITCGTGTTD